MYCILNGLRSLDILVHCSIDSSSRSESLCDLMPQDWWKQGAGVLQRTVFCYERPFAEEGISINISAYTSNWSFLMLQMGIYRQPTKNKHIVFCRFCTGEFKLWEELTWVDVRLSAIYSNSPFCRPIHLPSFTFVISHLSYFLGWWVMLKCRKMESSFRVFTNKKLSTVYKKIKIF